MLGPGRHRANPSTPGQPFDTGLYHHRESAHPPPCGEGRQPPAVGRGLPATRHQRPNPPPPSTSSRRTPGSNRRRHHPPGSRTPAVGWIPTFVGMTVARRIPRRISPPRHTVPLARRGGVAHAPIPSTVIPANAGIQPSPPSPARIPNARRRLDPDFRRDDGRATDPPAHLTAPPYRPPCASGRGRPRPNPLDRHPGERRDPTVAAITRPDPERPPSAGSRLSSG